MDNPDGTGSLKISRMTIESDSVSFDFEGSVEGYGTVFASHTLCLLYTSPSPRDRQKSRMPSSA